MLTSAVYLIKNTIKHLNSDTFFINLLHHGINVPSKTASDGLTLDFTSL